MDADAGIFVEDALQTGLTDAAEAGDFGDGGLAVDTAVQKIYGPAEKNGVRIAGGRGNGSGFGKGEHEKLQVRSSSLGIGGQPAEGLQVAAVAVRVSGALPGEGVQIQQELLLGVRERKHLFAQPGGERAFRGKGEDKKVRAFFTGHNEFMKLQGLMKNDGAAGEVVDSFIAGYADLSIRHVKAFPEIVAFSRKFIAFFIMNLKEGIKRGQLYLPRDGMCDPDHEAFLSAPLSFHMAEVPCAACPCCLAMRPGEKKDAVKLNEKYPILN